jgi:hypothetical protein
MQSTLRGHVELAGCCKTRARSTREKRRNSGRIDGSPKATLPKLPCHQRPRGLSARSSSISALGQNARCPRAWPRASHSRQRSPSRQVVQIHSMSRKPGNRAAVARSTPTLCIILSSGAARSAPQRRTALNLALAHAAMAGASGASTADPRALAERAGPTATSGLAGAPQAPGTSSCRAAEPGAAAIVLPCASGARSAECPVR